MRRAVLRLGTGRFTPVLAGLASIGFFALGCRGQAESEARVEAERVVLAVRALRDAEAPDKSPRLAALRQTACTLPDVCELRRECTEAYELYVAGLDGVRAVKKSLSGDASAPDGEQAVRLLDEAERKVKRGRERAERCASLEGQVAGRYKVQ